MFEIDLTVSDEEDDRKPNAVVHLPGRTANLTSSPLNNSGWARRMQEDSDHKLAVEIQKSETRGFKQNEESKATTSVMLKGTEQNIGNNDEKPSPNIDIVIGNKCGLTQYKDEKVSKQSRQALSLNKSPGPSRLTPLLKKYVSFKTRLWTIQKDKQSILIEDFNCSIPTSTVRVEPPKATIFEFTGFTTLSNADEDSTEPLPNKSSLLEAKDECAVCLEPLAEGVSKMKVCTHIFHKECIQQILSLDPHCPTCRRPSNLPRGPSPSGHMTVTLHPGTHCAKYPGVGSLYIQYIVKNGVQTAIHPDPGHAYTGINHHSYVPNTEEGKQLVKRMVYAFSRGLTWTIENSAMEAASSPHKLSVMATLKCWSDADYFEKCHEELDSLKIPAAVAVIIKGYPFVNDTKTSDKRLVSENSK